MCRHRTIAFACTALFASSSAVAGTLFFADIFNPDFFAGSIRRVETDGVGLATITKIGGGLRSVAVDAAAGKMYWTDVDSFKIARANLDGSEAEDIITSGLVFASGLALDTVNGKLYWGDQSDKASAIWRANLDGSSPELVISTAFHRGPVVDTANDKIYWSTSISQFRGEIWRADLDGENPEPVVTSLDPEFKPAAIALDVQGGKIYWTDYVVDMVRRANLTDGSDIDTLYIAPINHNPRGIDLDLAAGKVYWGQDVGIITTVGKIMRMNVDGSSIENAVTGLGLVNSIDLVDPINPPVCAGDIDRNGMVDGADLGVLLGAWGFCPNCELIACPADLNGDCMVDGADLGSLLGAWGRCGG